MIESEVPQHDALFGQWREIMYALNAQGEYVLVPSAGWDPANFANAQAWEAVAERIEVALQAVQQQKSSVLAYHMACNQMDVALLASYSGFSRWRVRWHLRPNVWKSLNAQVKGRYAAIFRMTPETLEQLPHKPTSSTGQHHE